MGDLKAAERLVEGLLPVVQKRVVRVLWRKSRHTKTGVRRQDVEDLTQEVFAQLFVERARILRSWSPDFAVPLDSFVGLVAERIAVSMLRSRKKNPWTEEARSSVELESIIRPDSGKDSKIVARQLLQRILDELRQCLGPKGWHLFELLILEDRPIDEVARETGLSRAAVYKRKSRLRGVARNVALRIRAG